MAWGGLSKKNVFKVGTVIIAVLFLTQIVGELAFSERFPSLIVKFVPTIFLRQDGVRTTTDFRQLFAGSHLRQAKAFDVINNTDNVTTCPLFPTNLTEQIPIVLDELDYDAILAMYPNLSLGGRWKPPDCVARHRVAIIVPYRNRENQLKVFLRHMHRFLQRQHLDYGIYVVEMAEPTAFNRAMLMNIGFVESSKLYDYQCFIFHDVDLLPENELNLYTCPDQPRHMSAAINSLKYKLPYSTIFGGVCALTKEQFQKLNGFSNKFFGWGGEDDDMFRRIYTQRYKVIRYPLVVARYTMMKHKKEKPNPKTLEILGSGGQRFKTDGLNSLHYKLKSLNLNPLFTWIYVQIDQKEVEMT